MALENILEINAAIKIQKGENKIVLPRIAADTLSKNEDSVDLSSILKDAKVPKKRSSLDKNIVVGEEKIPYRAFKAFSDYLSEIKAQLYDYSSIAKNEIKKSAKNIGQKILTEIEDWGVIYYKTTFQKMARLTPLGAMTRYLEEMWIFVSKHVKY